MTRLARIWVVALLAWFGSGSAARAGWSPLPAASTGEAPAPAAPPASPAVRESTAPSPPPPPPVVPPPPAVGAPELLRGADAAVARGDLTSARILFQRLTTEAPTTPEAVEARRALSIMTLSAAAPGAEGAPAGGEAREQNARASAPAGADAIVLREEPYSTKTSERLRLTAWEKLDFGVTAFLYGMSLGFSYSLGLPSSSSTADFTTPIALGATAYTLGAIGYLSVAKPDRGDLPLMLAITSYIPTTTLLLGHFAEQNPNDHKVAIATVAAGVASIPLAIAITQKVNLDPGDTQLVRDAGFWGLVLCTAGTMGFGGETNNDFGYSYWQEPSGRKVAGFGLLGLFGGLGLGAAAAAGTEVSLERVRVTTWGGYGGGVIGALIGASVYGQQEDEGAFRGFTIGALTGLVVTFATTGGLDGIPPSARLTGPTAARTSPRLMPSFTSMTGADGLPLPALGVAGVL